MQLAANIAFLAIAVGLNYSLVNRDLFASLHEPGIKSTYRSFGPIWPCKSYDSFLRWWRYSGIAVTGLMAAIMLLALAFNIGSRPL